MSAALLLAALLATASAWRSEGATLEAPPPYVVYKSFRPHPMGCTASKPLFTRYSYSWADSATGDHGRTIQEGCMPYNQKIPVKGTWGFKTVQAANPDAVKDYQFRLRRPDSIEIKGIAPVKVTYGSKVMDCNRKGLMDPGQSYGPVGCLYDQWRLGDDQTSCLARDFRDAWISQYGTQRPAPGTWVAGNRTCAWGEGMAYDLSAVPATGSVQFELMTNEHVFRKDLATEKSPKSPKYLSVQLMNQIPVMVDVPTKSCDRLAGDRRYCEYSNPDQLMLNFKGWNDKTQFTQLEIAPIFTIPIGGIWRTTVFVSRMVEPPPATYTYKGYPVTRSVVAFDRGSPNQVTVVNRAGMMYTPPGTGFLGEPLTLNLKALTAGWHTLDMYGEARDTVLRGTQKVTQTTYVEVVKGCPPNNRVPFATFVSTDSYGSVPMSRGVPGTPTNIQGNAAAASNALKVFSYIPTQARWANLEFDMSFLSASTRLTSAQLWLFVSSVGSPTGTTAQLTRVTLEAYDNSVAPPKSGVPCVPPITTCTPAKVGSGAFNGRVMAKIKGKYAKITLDPTKLNKYMGKTLKLSVVMPQQVAGKVQVDTAQFRARSTRNAPMLILQGSCP